MRIGIKIGISSGPETTLNRLVSQAQDIERRGFHSAWMPHIFGLDAITAQAVIGYATETLELGTAVVPTFPRHPSAMAQQVLTAQAAANGRFTLGIGLSHKLVIEDMMGLRYDRPALHMAEYLEVLKPLLSGKQAVYQGQQYSVNMGLQIHNVTKPQVIVAALGPKMLALAGKEADGTITWMTGAKTLATHIVPSINAAADEAGRPVPRIVAGLPVVLTDKTDETRDAIAKQLALYGQLPSYKSMLEREGVASPGDIALVGEETELRKQLQSLRDAGVTDLNAAVLAFEPGQYERTLSFLQSELTS